MNSIDREGIFRANVTAWTLKTNEKTESIAVNVTGTIVSQWDNDEWMDWSGYEDHEVSGDWYIIGKGGNVNQTGIDQLVRSMGWDGNIDSLGGPPPNVVVQITVKADEWRGQVRFRGEWMNPGDYQITGAADPETVAAVQTKYGSLLRAAAAAVPHEDPVPVIQVAENDTATEPPPAAPDPPDGPVHPDSTGEDELPF